MWKSMSMRLETWCKFDLGNLQGPSNEVDADPSCASQSGCDAFCCLAASIRGLKPRRIPLSLSSPLGSCCETPVVPVTHPSKYAKLTPNTPSLSRLFMYRPDYSGARPTPGLRPEFMHMLSWPEWKGGVERAHRTSALILSTNHQVGAGAAVW